MRGGAIAVLVWAALLSVLLVINVIWAGSAIQAAMFGFAIVIVAGSGLTAIALNRSAIRRGPPAAEEGRIDAVPDLSFGAMLLGIAVGVALYGQVFGKSLTYVGLGLVVIALGRLLVETRTGRRSRQRYLLERAAPPADGVDASGREAGR